MAGSRDADRADGGNRWPQQRAFGVGETRGGLCGEPRGGDVGPIAQRLGNHRRSGVGDRRLDRGVDQRERRRLRRAHGGAERGECRLHVAFRLHAQQLRLTEIHAREAQVESRFQPAVGQRAHLIDDELPGVDGLLRDALHGERPLRVEVRAIDVEQHQGAQQRDVPRLRLGAQRLRLHERARAPEVRHQLGRRDAEREAIEDRRVVEPAGGDARVVGRDRARDVADKRRPVRRLRLQLHLRGRLRGRLSRENPRMPGERALFGVPERERLRNLREHRRTSNHKEREGFRRAADEGVSRAPHERASPGRALRR
jgi:hypothetical protein